MANLAFFTIALLNESHDDNYLSKMLDVVWNAASSGSGLIELSKNGSEASTWGKFTVPKIFQQAKYENRIISTISLWTDIESVFVFTYTGLHGQAFGKRTKWFTSTNHPNYVAWWEDEGSIPQWEDACERYESMTRLGATLQGFDFKTPYDANGQPLMMNREVIQQKMAFYKNVLLL